MTMMIMAMVIVPVGADANDDLCLSRNYNPCQ